MLPFFYGHLTIIRPALMSCKTRTTKHHQRLYDQGLTVTATIFDYLNIQRLVYGDEVPLFDESNYIALCR